MKNLASVEKLLKRCFKEKVTVTTATMVAFLITGTAVLGATYTEQYTAGDNTIESQTVLKNEGNDGTVNIWEDPNDNNQVTLTNNGTILQKGTGKAIAAVNIANAADFTNNGIISVDRDGNDVGSAISQGFGGLGVNSPSTSSSIVNEKTGKIEVKNVAIATGIGADGYKKELTAEGRNKVEIENSGDIKINSLTKKELTTAELNTWNLLNGSKFKNGTIQGSGSIGGGIVAGNLVSVKNAGTISVENFNPMLITGTLRNGETKTLTIGGVGIASAHDVTKSEDKITRVNISNEESAEISMNGNFMMGITAVGGIDIKNAGKVLINGTDGVGVLLGEGATLENTGIIALNVFGEDKAYSGNIAMKGEENAVISSTGTIQLTDITAEKISEDELAELETFVSGTLMVGGEHTGIITNASGSTILAVGEEVTGNLGDVQEDEVIKTDDTVSVVGGKLDGVLNIGEDFVVEDGKFLAKVESEELSIGGTINSGNANGIEIGEGNTVKLTGAINSENIAINLEDGALLLANGASIKGDITSTGSSEITLENGTRISGDILLGEQDDKLTIDSLTGNLLSKDTVIDGGAGDNTLNLGTEGKVTTVSSTISNFENQNLSGFVVLNSDANIVANENSGDITLGKDSLLVVRISGDENHAFTDIDGNKVTTDSNGKVMLETNNLNVGKDGKAVINLSGTKLDIAEKDIIASQYVYDITFAPVRMEGTLLNVSLKTLNSMGINSKYQGAFDSIVTSGNLSAISNSTSLGKQSALENLLGQIVEMNPYSVSTKMSHNSLMGWNNGLKSLRSMPEAGEWLVQATGTGNYENYKGTVGHESNTTGLLATAEYGIMKDTSLGFAFGGGKQSGELKDSSSDLESDTFYIGAFAKKNIENFRLLGSLGYQKNKFDAKRVLDNGLDKFDFDKSFDTDGFSAMLETRYIVPINETLTVEPKLVLDYTNISQDSINEGTEPMGMEIDSHKIGTYGAEVGVDLVKTFVGDNGYSGKAFAGIAYGYTGGDTDESLEAKIGNGSKFDIDAVDMDTNTGKATIGVELNNGKGLNYGVGYTFEAGKDTKNSKVTLGFGYKF